MNDSIYQIQIQRSENQWLNLEVYRGKVLLVVNVASRCGFTNQYKTLEQWYRKYQPLGFEILAFPCNQFANQEPKNLEEIRNFATSCFATTFPIFAKIKVNGPGQAPIYQFLKQHLQQSVFYKNVPWNFTKYLIDRSGNIAYRFWPIASSQRVEKKF